MQFLQEEIRSWYKITITLTESTDLLPKTGAYPISVFGKKSHPLMKIVGICIEKFFCLWKKKNPV